MTLIWTFMLFVLSIVNHHYLPLADLWFSRITFQRHIVEFNNRRIVRNPACDDGVGKPCTQGTACTV